MSEVLINKTGEEKVCVRKVEQAIKDWLTDQSCFLGTSKKRTGIAFVFPQLGNPYYAESGRYYPGVVIVFEERYRAHRRKTLAEELAS
ncbi:hypothetical protein D3C80_1856260 [compost metagenome]